jgi:predicted nucleic acid-binding protein
MDEKKGREAAKARGLKVAGTLAVLLDGARHGLFDGMQALERLEATFLCIVGIAASDPRQTQSRR